MDCDKPTAGACQLKPPQTWTDQFPRIPSFGSPDGRGLFCSTGGVNAGGDARVPSFDPADCDPMFQAAGHQASATSSPSTSSAAPGRPGTIAMPIPSGLGNASACQWQELKAQQLKAVLIASAQHREDSSTQLTTDSFDTRPELALDIPSCSTDSGLSLGTEDKGSAGGHFAMWSPGAGMPPSPEKRAVAEHELQKVAAAPDHANLSHTVHSSDTQSQTGNAQGRSPCQQRTEISAMADSDGRAAWQQSPARKGSEASQSPRIEAQDRTIMQPPTPPTRPAPRRQPAPIAEPSGAHTAQRRSLLHSGGSHTPPANAAASLQSLRWSPVASHTGGMGSRRSSGGASWCRWARQKLGFVGRVAQRRGSIRGGGDCCSEYDEDECQKNHAEDEDVLGLSTKCEEVQRRESIRGGGECRSEHEEACQKSHAEVADVLSLRRECEDELQRYQAEVAEHSALELQEAAELRARAASAEEQTLELRECLLLAEGRCNQKCEEEVQSCSGVVPPPKVLPAADRGRREHRDELQNCEQQEALEVDVQCKHELEQLDAIKETVPVAAGEETATALRPRTLPTTLDAAEQSHKEREEELDKQRRATQELIARRAARLSRPHVSEAFETMPPKSPARASEPSSPGDSICSPSDFKETPVPPRRSIAALRERFQELDERHKRDLSLLLPGGQQALLIGDRGDDKAMPASKDRHQLGEHKNVQAEAGLPNSYTTAEASTSSGLRFDVSGLSSALSPVDGLSPPGTPSSCGLGAVLGLARDSPSRLGNSFDDTTEDFSSVATAKAAAAATDCDSLAARSLHAEAPPAPAATSAQRLLETLKADEARQPALSSSAAPCLVPSATCQTDTAVGRVSLRRGRGRLSVSAPPGPPGQRAASRTTTPMAPWEEDSELVGRPRSRGRCEPEVADSEGFKPRPRPRRSRASTGDIVSESVAGEADARGAAPKKRPKRKPVRGQSAPDQSPTKLNHPEACTPPPQLTKQIDGEDREHHDDLRREPQEPCFPAEASSASTLAAMTSGALEVPQPGASRRSRSASRRWPRPRAHSRDSQELQRHSQIDFSFGQEGPAGHTRPGIADACKRGSVATEVIAKEELYF